jgi:DeoR family glycerol-3-phosphate regulon repressor
MSLPRMNAKPKHIPPRDMHERHAAIESIVKQRGFATIESLATQFRVTVQTLRRDLALLADAGRVSRFHGGAGLPSSVENIDYSTRKVLNLEEKRRIAKLVAEHVPNHSSLLINIGTTNEAVARALVRHDDLRVITNSLNVAELLARETQFNIIVTGGTVRNRDGGLIGQSACDAIDQFRADIGVIGISGIDVDGTLLDYDYDEVRAAQAIVRNARKVFLVADHTKFARRPLVRLGSLSQIDALFTDEAPPQPIRKLLKATGVALHVVKRG